MIRPPQNKMMGNALWIWKEPVEGHKYVMGVDVSRGDSEDFSSFQIIDFDEREQVAEFVGKLPPDTIYQELILIIREFKSLPLLKKL